MTNNEIKIFVRTLKECNVYNRYLQTLLAETNPYNIKLKYYLLVTKEKDETEYVNFCINNNVLTIKNNIKNNLYY